MKSYKILLLLIISFLISCSNTQRSPSSQDGSVLYIGDSQSAGFLGALVFDQLTNNFKENNIEVYGVGSSSPRHWADTIKGKSGSWLCDAKRRGRFNKNYQIDLRSRICKTRGNETIYGRLNSNKADHVIFQFLGNSMGQSEEQIKISIDKLLGNLGNQECLFITSPPFFDGQISASETELSSEETKYIKLMERNKHRLITEGHIINAIGDRCRVVSGMRGESMEDFSRDRENYGKDAIHLSRKGAQNFLDHFKSDLP